MCKNIKKIRNRYTGKEVYVTCGHCEACRQEKAAKRASRIRNNSSFGTIALFLTLTYDRLSCPVVFRDDVEQRKNHLNVYRLKDYRRVRVDGRYTMDFRKRYELTQIGELDDVCYSDEMSNFDIPKLTRLNKKYVGICWYKDVQDFFKRLRYYIDYHYGKDIKYSYWACTEYGEDTYRPHVHSLLFIPVYMQDDFRKAIFACWPFADKRRMHRGIEVARDAASYVASYLAKPSDFPKIYDSKSFRQKYSMSKGFGVGLDCFQLSKILEKVEQGSLTFNSTTHRDGVPVVRTCAIPQYVISRFFPKYKGFSQYSDIENMEHISRLGATFYVPPYQLYYLQEYSIEHGVEVSDSHLLQAGVTVDYTDSLQFIPDKSLDYYDFDQRYWNPRNQYLCMYTPDEQRMYGVMLRHCYELYHRITGRSVYDYAIDFVRTWNCYKSTCYRMFMESSSEDNFVDAYDNVADYVLGKVRSISLDELGLKVTSLNPNEFEKNTQKHNRLLQTFYLKCKTRKVNNMCHARMGFNV